MVEISIFFNVLLSLIVKNFAWYNPNTFRLPRREPVDVGYSREIKVTFDKATHRLTTLSMNPTIFQVKNFLSPEECDYLIFMAKSHGLKDSPLKPQKSQFQTTKKIFDTWDVNNDTFIEPIEFTYIKGKGDLYLTEYEIMVMIEQLKMDKNFDNKIDFNEFQLVKAEVIHNYFRLLHRKKPNLRSRLSKQAWLWHFGMHDALLEGFHERLARLTLLPRNLIEVSEPMQVVQYEDGGHYHCHHDSDEVDPIMPCCTFENQDLRECRHCRYATVMLYLSNVTYGGETAFQVADNTSFSYEHWEREAVKKCNLADNCDSSNLVVKPTKGTALFWYNHEINATNGWLGDLDPMTYHGGCDVIDDKKWIANMWINVIGKKGSRDSYKGWAGKWFNDKKIEL